MPDSRRLVVQIVENATQSLGMLDTENGAVRTFYASAYAIADPAVSPDGRRIAFMGGDSIWDVVEVEIPTGRVQVMPSAGGVSWWPAWGPSGSHYAFISDKLPSVAVRQVSINGGGVFSRVLAELSDATLTDMRWSPDDQRFTFTAFRRERTATMMANASGSPAQPVDPAADTSTNGVWSPDGQWLAYRRRVGTDEQLVKIRPGSRNQPEVLKAWRAGNAGGEARTPVDWSPDGQWILAVRSRPGIFLISADGATERQISSRPSPGRHSLGFSRDGRSVLILHRNTSGTGAPWELWSIDVATGTDRLLVDVPLPETAGDIAGFSLHPDGTRFLTSVANWPFDIWMLEGFEQ
jgi:Tol biopolymer transport system component